MHVSQSADTSDLDAFKQRRMIKQKEYHICVLRRLCGNGMIDEMVAVTFVNIRVAMMRAKVPGDRENMLLSVTTTEY